MLVYFKKNPEELELKSNRMEKLELYKLKREPKHTTQQHPIRYKEEHARFSNHQLSQSGDWFKNAS